MDFGDWCNIEQKRYRGENEIYLYKVIGTGRANYYVPVPVDANNTKAMGESCEVVKCIRAGVCEEKVETFRLQDVKPFEGAIACPLYVDYKKSCQTLKDHERDLISPITPELKGLRNVGNDLLKPTRR